MNPDFEFWQREGGLSVHCEAFHTTATSPQSINLQGLSEVTFS